MLCFLAMYKGLRVLGALFALLGSLPVGAQVATSRAVGTVTDASGGVVSGADVSLANEATNVTLRSKTSSAGTYVFDAVPPGTYTVTVSAKGFKTAVSTGNALTVGQPMTVNSSLQVGNVSEQVDVKSSAEEVQTSSSGNEGNVLGEKQIKDLPIVGTRGRNPLDLVLLQPGVVSGANTGGGIHVNGARDRAWNYTLDGIDNNDISAGGSNSAPTKTNPDSLQEYRVITAAPTAEYGRNSGGQVTLETKAGTNQFHGGAFWFYRTPRLNANEWEYNLQGLGKTQFVQNIYGGDIGGPVWKDHTFFFVNIQGLAAHDSSVVSRTVYTQTARDGVWRYAIGQRTLPAGVAGASVDAAGNPLPGVAIGQYNIFANDPQHIGMDPNIKAQITSTPLPNNFAGGSGLLGGSSDGLNTALYTFSAPSIENQQDNTIRIDHVINERHALFARASWGHQNSDCDSVNLGQMLFPGSGCTVNTLRNPRNLAFSWRATLTPTFTNELIVGQSNFSYSFVSPLAKPGDLFIESEPVDTIGSQQAIGNARTLNTNQIVDNASFSKGAHLLKFGTNLRFSYHDDDRGSIAAENANQGVNFSTSLNPVDPVAFTLPGDIQTANDLPALQTSINFLLGRVGRTDQGFASNGTNYIPGDYHFKAHYNQLEYYLQDTYKVSPRLTVDLGVRLEMYLAPSEGAGRIRMPDLPLVYGAAPTDNAAWVKGDLYHDTKNAWGPSIGIAYDPFGDGKTAVRANYRIAYDPINTFVLSNAIFQNLPGITQSVENSTFGVDGGRLANLPTFSVPTVDPNSLSQPPGFSNNSITTVDPNLKLATTHMWMFQIQRQVANNTILSATYNGHRAYHLLSSYDANQIDLAGSGLLNAFNVASSGGESAFLDQLTSGDARRNPGESGAAFVRREFPSDLALGSFGAVAGSLATQPGEASVLRRFPQFQSADVIDSNGFSTYQGLTLQILRRLTSGLEAQFSYTYSKSLDTGSYDPTFTVAATGNDQSASSTPFDIANRGLNYARSDFDRRHVFQSYWVAELPFGRGKLIGRNVGPLLDRLIGGWQFSGLFSYYSGRPFTAYSGSYTDSNIVQSPANCMNCSQSLGSLFTDQATGYAYYFDDAARAKFGVPNAGVAVGTAPRNFFQSQAWFDMDASLSKRIKLTEGTNIELRADATNLTNTPQWDNPTTNLQDATFGRLYEPITGRSRKIQLGVKVNF